MGWRTTIAPAIPPSCSERGTTVIAQNGVPKKRVPVAVELSSTAIVAPPKTRSWAERPSSAFGLGIIGSGGASEINTGSDMETPPPSLTREMETVTGKCSRLLGGAMER